MTAEQMLKAVFWYQAIGTIAAIIIGLALVFYRRRRQIEKDQNPPVGKFTFCASVFLTKGIMKTMFAWIMPGMGAIT